MISGMLHFYSTREATKETNGFTLVDGAMDDLNSIAPTHRIVQQHLEVNEFYSVRKLNRMDSDEANSSESEK